jgi:hypothetical protein
VRGSFSVHDSDPLNTVDLSFDLNLHWVNRAGDNPQPRLTSGSYQMSASIRGGGCSGSGADSGSLLVYLDGEPAQDSAKNISAYFDLKGGALSVDTLAWLDFPMQCNNNNYMSSGEGSIDGNESNAHCILPATSFGWAGSCQNGNVKVTGHFDGHLP